MPARGVETLCFGTLAANPHPDSTAEFFRELEAVLNRATEGNLRILRPYATLSKAEVIRRGAGLPLHLTFSCVDPVEGSRAASASSAASAARASGPRVVPTGPRTPQPSRPPPLRVTGALRRLG